MIVLVKLGCKVVLFMFIVEILLIIEDICVVVDVGCVCCVCYDLLLGMFCLIIECVIKVEVI